MRDHLLNPDAARASLESKEREINGDEMKVQLGVVQGVKDQLENALNALRAIGGDVGMDGAQVRTHFHAE